MLLHISDVLTADQVSAFREELQRAEWIDGRVTAGHQSALAKDNMQLPEDSAAGRRMSDDIVARLQSHPLFMAAALPLKVFPPLFNRYEGNQSFGNHVDNAVRQVAGTPHRVRTDVSATLFLTAPEEYDGGELVIEDTYGVHSVKLPAGHVVLYPSSSLHHVRPVTRGIRLASFFWIQSMVRDDAARTLLFDLDMAIQGLGAQLSGHPSTIQLTGVYHNLLRRWADV